MRNWVTLSLDVNGTIVAWNVSTEINWNPFGHGPVRLLTPYKIKIERAWKSRKGIGETMFSPRVAWKCRAWEYWLYQLDFFPRDGKSHREVCFPPPWAKTAVAQLEVVSSKVSLRLCLKRFRLWQVKSTALESIRLLLSTAAIPHHSVRYVTPKFLLGSAQEVHL